MRGDSILLTYLSAFLTISVHRFLAGDSLGWKVRMLNIYCQLVLQKVEPLFAIQECKSTHLGLQKRFRAESDSAVVWRLDSQRLGAGPVSAGSRSSLAGPLQGQRACCPREGSDSTAGPGLLGQEGVCPWHLSGQWGVGLAGGSQPPSSPSQSPQTEALVFLTQFLGTSLRKRTQMYEYTIRCKSDHLFKIR